MSTRTEWQPCYLLQLQAGCQVLHLCFSARSEVATPCCRRAKRQTEVVKQMGLLMKLMMMTVTSVQRFPLSVKMTCLLDLLLLRTPPRGKGQHELDSCTDTPHMCGVALFVSN